MDYEKIKTSFKEDILIYTLICYALGLIYHVVFYGYYHIPIIYYLSLTDLLLFAVKIFGITLLAVIILDYVLYHLLGEVLQRFYNLFVKSKLDKENVYIEISDILSIGLYIFCSFFVIAIIHPKEFIFVLYFVPTFLYWFAKLKFRGYKLKDLPSFFYGFFISYLCFLSFMSANSYINSKRKFHIEFKYEEQNYNTDNMKDLYYLGETSSYIFIYDTNKQSAYVYNKSDIKSLKYWN